MIPKTKLERLYTKEKNSAEEVGKLLHVNPHQVRYWMKKYGIPRRSISESKKEQWKRKGCKIDREFLVEEYQKNKKSVSKIAKEFNLKMGTIYYSLVKYGIKTRNHYEAIRLFHHKELPDLNKIDNNTWKALAWVLDAEGSIGFQSYRKMLPQISIGVTSKKFIDNMIKEFPQLWKRWETKRNNMRDYDWTIYQIRNNSIRVISHVLKNTIPYLTTKKYTALLLKKYCDSRIKNIGKKISNKEAMQ